MDVERSHEEVAEDALDREIRAVLAITPSPLFLAHVRARIANEAQYSRWSRPWGIVTTGAFAVAAIVAVVAVITVQRPQTIVPPVLESPQPTRDQPVPSGTPSEHIKTGSSETVVDRQLQPRQTVRHQEPEVLVSSSEVRAFRTLFEAARAGRISVAIADRPSADTLLQPIEDIPVPPIAVPPIAIEPLPPFAQ
jgi:hypothetical protein